MVAMEAIRVTVLPHCLVDVTTIDDHGRHRLHPLAPPPRLHPFILGKEFVGITPSAFARLGVDEHRQNLF